MSRRFEEDRDAKDEETLGSFYMGRMQAPPESTRVMPRGLIASVVVLSFIGILWYAYPDNESGEPVGDVPVITADRTTFKSKPDDPGGMEVRHQDSTVFNPLVRKSADEVERLLPRPEEPMDKENAIKSADTAPTPAAPEMPTANEGLKLEPAIDAVTEKVVPEQTAPAAATAKEEVTLTELATARAADKEEAASVSEVAKPVEKAEEPKVEKKTETVKAAEKEPAKTTASAAGGFYIQLGAFRNAGGAQEEWRKLQSRFPQSLSSLSSRVERADLGAKGVWHRLYAGPLPEGKAREICGRLKTESSSGCMVKKL